MKKTVLVAIKKPNQPLEVKEIEDKLEVLQEIVEGYIEAIYPMENLEDHSITIFGNEEAKMIHQPSNFGFTTNKIVCVEQPYSSKMMKKAIWLHFNLKIFKRLRNSWKRTK